MRRLRERSSASSGTPGAFVEKLATAVAALRDTDWFTASCQRLVGIREALTGQLTDLGFSVMPSSANFLFVQHQSHPAAELAVDLRERGVLVRHFKGERISNYLRISVGDEAQCEVLLKALSEIIA